MDSNTETQKETKKELFAALDKLKKEVNSSRNELNKIDDEKESWFEKKDELSDDIIEKIKDIKENKKKRDDFTNRVKKLKEKRNEFNQEIRKKISELVKLKEGMRNLTKIQENRRFSGHKKCSAFLRESKVKDPYKIKGEIDGIEVKLETEAMSFEKEKELSKKLKLLKKLFHEASAIIDAIDKIKKLNSEIDSSKKSSQNVHNEIQKLAKESQKLHEGIIKSSKEIDELKIKEEGAFKNFLNLKKDFNNINNKLKEKLSEMGVIREKINKFKLEEDEKRKLKEITLIKNKEQEIEEKVKTGKKLTTEDFLVFQEALKNKKDIQKV